MLHRIAFPVVSEWCQEEVVGVVRERFVFKPFSTAILPIPNMILERTQPAGPRESTRPRSIRREAGRAARGSLGASETALIHVADEVDKTTEVGHLVVVERQVAPLRAVQVATSPHRTR